MPRITAVLTLFLICNYSVAQVDPVNREDFRIHIKETNHEITIDGLLDETPWAGADTVESFYRVLPIDTGFATARTKVMLAYDEANLYMGIICFDPTPGKRPVESLRRDFSFGNNDNFLVFIDTYNDYTNGFSFGISAAGAQWDGIQANGGFVSLDWDAKWYSAVKSYDNRWVAEFAIPFRSIRYREGITEWGINFSRLDLKQNEKSSWAPMPRQFQTANLAFTGTLVWDKPPPRLGTRFSLIPYISGRATQQVEAREDIQWDGDVGMDAKVTLSTSMNLDLTVNPDYSQVEVDQQVLNLDRFELYFPEKRQFFLENSDIFASLGSENIRPFFSRRIGLEVPVIGGARLSGKIGEPWRIGVMDMQTAASGKIPANNFGVAAIQRQIFTRSNVGLFIVNKQATSNLSDSTFVQHDYNRIVGMDLNLASADNQWTGKFFYHQSFYPDSPASGFATAGDVEYNTRNWRIGWNQAFVDSEYIAETGFVRRTGFHRMNPFVEYKFFTPGTKIANHGPNLDLELFFNEGFQQTDRATEVTYGIEWLNRSRFEIELEENYIKLQAPFDPTNTGGDSLATGSEFNFSEFAISYASDPRKLFNYQGSIRYGKYYNGTRLNMNGGIDYRVQPYGRLSVLASYSNIELPEPYSSADLVLIGPRLDITFTDKVFLTTFAQYNNQIDNFNLNVRFQWRYAPVSDLFIVYTENSYPQNFAVKDRALVAKLSYWFN